MPAPRPGSSALPFSKAPVPPMDVQILCILCSQPILSSVFDILWRLKSTFCHTHAPVLAVCLLTCHRTLRPVAMID